MTAESTKLTSIFVKLKSPTQKGRMRVESGTVRLLNHSTPPVMRSGHKAFSEIEIKSLIVKQALYYMIFMYSH